MEIIGAIKGVIDRATKPPVVVDGENLVGLSQDALKEKVFQQLVSDPMQWNGAHAMHSQIAQEQMNEVAKGGKQAMISFLQGAEKMHEELGHKK